MIDWYREKIENQTFDLEMVQHENDCLREQVESLKRFLWEESKQKQELEQELHHTNQDLVQMNEEIRRLSGDKQLTFEQAKEVAKTLVNEKSVAKALTKLLSAIYGKTLLLEELPSLQKLVSSRHLSNQRDRHNFFLEKYAKLRARFIKLGSRFIGFKAQFTRLQDQFPNPLIMKKNPQEFKNLQLLSENHKQLLEVIQQSSEHIQQTKEIIEESKRLLGRDISLDHKTHPPTGIVARQHNQVEQQSEIVKTMQKKVDEQKNEERKERE